MITEITTVINNQAICLQVHKGHTHKVRPGDVYVARVSHDYRIYVVLHDYSQNVRNLALLTKDMVFPSCGVASILYAEKIGRLTMRQARELSELLYTNYPCND